MLVRCVERGNAISRYTTAEDDTEITVLKLEEANFKRAKTSQAIPQGTCISAKPADMKSVGRSKSTDS
jgi:hypothetical protein